MYLACAEDLIAAGQRIAQNLRGGETLALKGPMGAGKTTFTQGLGLGLEVGEPVTSPTFTIISQYDGRLHLNHIDTYRLAHEEEFLYTGGEELFGGENVSVVEWPELIKDILPADTYWIEISPDPRGGRMLTVPEALWQ